jgi:tetratricopeptide (TPR) repeat protein
MPLAIELAAARLRTMSPAQLTGRLGDRFALLTSGSRTALPRHQTLRAMVEWSWDLLSKPERVLARRLAALPAGATLGAAEGICCDEPDELGGELPAGAVLDALTGLADKSFVTVEEGADDTEPRYRMLDTIRVYCQERLAAAGEEDGIRDRMCGYYLALAETADPRLRARAPRPWFGVLTAESDNMHASLRWAIERRDARTALRFGAALAWYWYLCGQSGDCAALARDALELDHAAGSAPADRATAEARGVCAVIAANADCIYEPARELMETAAAAAAADPGGRALHPLIVYGQTQALRFGGEGERALRLLADYVDSADPWTSAAARLQGGDILRDLGRIEEATRYCDAALALFRDLEESWGTAITLTFRTELDKLAGDYRGAIAALEEAAVYSRHIASASDLAWLYRQLAGLRLRTGDYAAAHAVLDVADRSVWAQGNWGRQLRLIRAELAWREGQPAEAVRLCREILRDEAERPTFWVPLRALTSARLGVLTLEAGDITHGTALLGDALGAAAAAGDRPAAATATEGLAAAALRTDGARRAATLLGAADSIRGAVDHSSLDAPAVRAAAEEQLGPAAFDAAYQQGLSLPDAEALDFARASAAPASERLATVRLGCYRVLPLGSR